MLSGVLCPAVAKDQMLFVTRCMTVVCCSMITDPTHRQGNILDLVLTNNPDLLANDRVCCDPFLIETDNYAISILISKIIFLICQVLLPRKFTTIVRQILLA